MAISPADPQYRQFLNKHLHLLGEATRGLGNTEGVAEVERELAKLRDSDPAMVAFDEWLAAVLTGKAPKDNAEHLALAQRAYDTRRFASAAKLWAAALEADPKLADDRRARHLYNAACVAALAVSGAGKDGPPPDDIAKAKLRQQALNWLNAELSVWTKLLESGTAESKASIAKTLKHWQEDSDLAGVRDDRAIEALAEPERAASRRLLAGVATLLETTTPPLTQRSSRCRLRLPSRGVRTASG